MHSQSALCLISRHMLLHMTCHILLLETGQATKTDEHVHTLITTVFEIRGVHFALEQLKEHYLWTYCLSELGRPRGSDVNGPHSHVYIDPCPASGSKSTSDSRSRRTKHIKESHEAGNFSPFHCCNRQRGTFSNSETNYAHRAR